MPFLISVSLSANLVELSHFIRSNGGIVLHPGAYLLPWGGVPDALTQLVRNLVPAATKIVVAAVTDYWSLIE